MLCVRTLVEPFAELVVCCDEVQRGLCGGIVGRNGLDEGAEGGLDARKVRLQDDVHVEVEMGGGDSVGMRLFGVLEGTHYALPVRGRERGSGRALGAWAGSL
jgi:hypothetical protein